MGKRDFVFTVLLNEGARVLRPVGVQNVNGDVAFLDREDCFFMEHAGAHVGELPEFGVGNVGDFVGVVHDGGICHQEAGDISPVLIHVRVHGIGQDRTGDVAAAPGEHLDPSVGSGAVETWEHEVFIFSHFGLKLGSGGFEVDGFVQVEADHVLGVHEGKAEKFRHHPGAPVFAAGHDFILFHLIQIGVEGVQLLGHVLFQTQFFLDSQNAFADDPVHVGGIHVILPVGIQQIEQVGELGICRCPAAGGRDNNVTAVGISLNDFPDLAELTGIGNR